MVAYHDREWGAPTKNDQKLFEFLVLEGAQAGLSWQTILNRREGYRKAFKDFDPKKVACMSTRDVRRLMKDERIIRNRLKIESAIQNAKVFLEIQREYGSFASYLWAFVGGKPTQNKRKTHRGIPAETEVSKTLSKDLKKRGMSFVGPTIMYAFMQATGMVNDHTTDCFRHNEIQRLGRNFRI